MAIGSHDTNKQTGSSVYRWSLPPSFVLLLKDSHMSSFGGLFLGPFHFLREDYFAFLYAPDFGVLDIGEWDAGPFAYNPVLSHTSLCLVSPSPGSPNFNFFKESTPISRDRAWWWAGGGPSLDGARKGTRGSVHRLSRHSLFSIPHLTQPSVVPSTSES